jgi:hypothetical protein
MIVYSRVGLFDGRKRLTKKRMSDKNKRVYSKIRTYRKTWWHFKTRWDPE